MLFSTIGGLPADVAMRVCAAGSSLLRGMERVTMQLSAKVAHIASVLFPCRSPAVGHSMRRCVQLCTAPFSTIAACFRRAVGRPVSQGECHRLVQRVLNALQGNTFGQEVPALLDEMERTVAAYNKNSDEGYTAEDVEAVRERFNALLEGGSFTLGHTIDPGIDESQMVIDTFGRRAVWVSNEKIVPERTCDPEKTASFQRALSAFYRDQGVSNSEDLVHSLMVRMSAEYSSLNIFSRLHLIDSEGYALPPRGQEDSGVYFDFKDGMATVSDRCRYEKISSSIQGPPQFFDITRTVSTNPASLSSNWTERVNVQRVGALGS